MSAKRSPGKSTTVVLNVPNVITDQVNSVFNFLWDKTCPFGSLYVWIMTYLGLYYLFWLPEINLKLQDGTLTTRKVDKTLRGWLFLSVLASTVLGYLIIKKGCNNAGPSWAFIWFIIALIVSFAITQIILSLTENVTVPNALELVKAINKGQ